MPYSVPMTKTQKAPSAEDVARAQEVLELSRTMLRATLSEAGRKRTEAMQQEEDARKALNLVLSSAMADDHGITATQIARLAGVGRSKLYSLPDQKVKDLPQFKTTEALTTALTAAGRQRIDTKATADQARRDAIEAIMNAKRMDLLDVTEIVALVGIDRMMAYRTADQAAVQAALAEIEGQA